MFLSDLFSRNAKPCWVPPGGVAEVAGFVLPRGMLYVGTDLKAVSIKGLEPALVNPSFPVDVDAPARAFRWSTEVTGYGAIGPRVKALYLQWLSEGRKSPETSTGCLMLFLFGLERRVLFDSQHEKTQPEVSSELPAIDYELKRLVDLYGAEHPEFASQAEAFREFIETLQDPDPQDTADWTTFLQPPRSAVPKPFPRALKIALGRVAGSGAPISAELAYCWYLHSPKINKRDTHRICAQQHRTLFLAEYAKHCGEGLSLEGTFEKITAVYAPISPTFGGESYEAFLEIPDITEAPKALSWLERIGDLCDNKLAEYARFVAISPDHQGSLEAIASLPVELWPAGRRFPFERLLRELAEQGGRPSVMPYSKLLAWLPRFTGKPVNKAVALKAALARWGLLVEPEVSSEAHPEHPVALYQQVKAAREHPVVGEYERAELACKLLLFIVRADGALMGKEYAVLEGSLSHWPTLTVSQKARLCARLSLWLAEPRNHLEGSTSALDSLSSKDRARIGEFLYTVADEIGMAGVTMTRILAQLSVQKGKKSRGAKAPVEMQQGQPGSGFSIPTAPAPDVPPEPVKPKVVLDMSKVAQLQAESAEVSTMLNAIFTEEPTLPEAAAAPTKSDPSSSAPILGLDEKHSDFAKRLITQESWTLPELTALAASAGLLLDGALERINEAAYDHFDDPLFEGDDPIELNLSIVKELACQ